METRDQQMRVREADGADSALLAKLIRDSFRTVAERLGLNAANCPTHPSNCTVDWIERDVASGRRYFILEVDGTPVGCVALEKASDDQCYLERLAVLPGRRRQGYGRALVDRVLREAKTLGTTAVDIGIIAEEADLRDWYKRLGFVEGQTRDFEHLPFAVTFMSCGL